MVKRIDWIDISKFAAITMMVAGHIGLPRVLSDFIHMFHMPIFFVLSGMCFESQKYKLSEYCRRKVKTLLVPYFFWSGINYIYYVLFSEKQDISILEYIRLLCTNDANKPKIDDILVIQWFLTCIFFTEILLYCIVKISEYIAKNTCKQNTILILFVFLLCVFNYIYILYRQYNPLGIGSAIMGTILCILGYVLKKRFINMEWNKKKLPILFVLLLVFLCAFYFNGTVNMRTLQYNNQVVFLIGALAGSIIIFYISAFVCKVNQHGYVYKFMVFYGKNTIIILCLNRLVQWTVEGIVNGYFALLPHTNIVTDIFRAVIVMALEMVMFIPIIIGINNYIPFSIGRHKEMKER